jgi:sugar/nucleoside kinase (ribokinase family)
VSAAPRIDLACGEPSFVDLTFVGLDAVPAAGEERHAHELVRGPGGAAITAIGAARLGLSVALASPLGDDADGDFVRAALDAEGVRWTGRRVARTSLTAVMPAGGERAMATFDNGAESGAAELGEGRPRAVVLSLDRLAVAPAGAAVYATVGDETARRRGASGELPEGVASARALLVNEREALLLSGADDVETAARALATRTPLVVVTLGPRGALAVAEGGEETVRAEGVPFEAVDTTGAGDLFCAAYVWADLNGAPLLDRLRWAVLYAALSVRVATAVAGAVTLEALAEAGMERGLVLPDPRAITSMKEEW